MNGGDGRLIMKSKEKSMTEEKLFVYSYQCNKCGVRFHEELLENEKHVPTNIQPSQFCDIYIAPHYGVAECEVELVVK